MTKIVVISFTVFYFISFFFDADDWLANVLYYTYGRFELYRIFLSPFAGNSILMLIFGFLVFIPAGTKIENSQGSLRFLYLISMLSVVTNLLHNFISLQFWLIGWNDALHYQCMYV